MAKMGVFSDISENCGLLTLFERPCFSEKYDKNSHFLPLPKRPKEQTPTHLPVGDELWKVFDFKHKSTGKRKEKFRGTLQLSLLSSNSDKETRSKIWRRKLT